jgi:hypothetical protein
MSNGFLGILCYLDAGAPCQNHREEEILLIVPHPPPQRQAD